ncbi:hypothetical protein C8R43DRAFT_964888 [Mycena crocata]|nr:hypothetical protein C8R43DRAFT_964888 [Mycena crocata]
MPTRPSTESRLNIISICFPGAVNAIQTLVDAFQTPFLEPISTTARSLLTLMEVCVWMVHVKPGSDLPLSFLKHLGNFIETLHKIHTYLEAQQEKSKIKQFFRHGEMSRLLIDCNTGLKRALEGFKVQDANLLTDIADLQKFADDKHREVMDAIEAFSVNASSENASPKIFYGRKSDLADILTSFAQLEEAPPRIAILGAGGMGKTSLARAVLHHPQITGIYAQHLFLMNYGTALWLVQLIALKPDRMLLNLRTVQASEPLK